MLYIMGLCAMAARASRDGATVDHDKAVGISPFSPFSPFTGYTKKE